MKTLLRDITFIFIAAAVIFLLLQTTIQSFVVVGYCMEPNFEDGQRLVINKAIYHFHEPQRGDVIILHPPISPEDTYIKRLIALPGDTIEVKDETMYVNGSKLDEPYIKEPPRYTIPSKKIPENEYFVLGDNRNNANDSHNGWTVPRQNIVGKVWLSIWPPQHWGLIPHYPSGEPPAS